MLSQNLDINSNNRLKLTIDALPEVWDMLAADDSSH
jgi:hypothetical protein